MHPIVIVHRVEKPAVEEWDFTVEAAVIMVIVTAVDTQCFIKKRFENIVEEIVIIAMLFLKEFPQELFGPQAPGLIPAHAKPAFLLQEIQKYDLAQKLLGKVHSVDILGGKVVFNSFIL